MTSVSLVANLFYGQREYILEMSTTGAPIGHSIASWNQRLPVGRQLKTAISERLSRYHVTYD